MHAIVRPGAAIRALQKLDFPHKLGICERLFGRSLARRGVCWIDTAAGIPWKLDLALPTHRWIVYGKYEGSPFLDWARGWLPPEGVVVDSGANIGQMLLYLAQWIPRGRLLAVEPGPEAADWLGQCLRRNAGLPVELLRCALGRRSGSMVLVDADAELERRGACHQLRERGAGPAVTVRPLSELLRERGLERVDLWKLDVEGFELEALAGAEALLRDRRIRALYVELAFGNGERIRSYLEGFGYDCYRCAPGGVLEPAGRLPEHANGLFLPR